jgi:hypothetical protein
MTNEEMERGIEFLLKSQANFEARQASFEAQLKQTSQQVEVLAKTHTEFAQFVQSNLKAQSELSAVRRSGTSG